MLVNTNRKDNIVNFLIPKEFKEYIMEKIDKNEQEYAIKKRMKVTVVSEFYNLFNKSEQMSSTISSWSKFNRRERQICKVNRIGKEEEALGDRIRCQWKNFEILKEEAKKRK